MTRVAALAGKILEVDLGSSTISIEDTAPLAARFIGGLGINTYKLLTGMAAGTKPLDSESVIGFGAGALVGTIAPGSSRLSVNGLNAHNGGFGSASAGGAFAPELKYAGFDNLIVRGRAERPVYILIQDHDISIENADFLWGKTVGDTCDLLQARHNDEMLQVLAIGPAGENHLKAASVIVSRNRAAARCGLGSVMGAKNLKAIVVRGTGGLSVHDPKGFLEACHAASLKMRKTKTSRKLRKFGTPISFLKWNSQGSVPVKNFQFTHMTEERAQHLSCDVLRKNHIRKVFACFACPTPCSQYQEVDQGEYAGTRGEKIECQNIWDFGAKFDVDSLPAILKASALCTEYGLDISSASGVISWAFECYQRGIFSQDDTDGLDLTWGNHDALISLLRRMAYREGAIGELLAKGVQEASQIVGQGSEYFAMHVKGQELAEELRPFKGWALGVAVAERGGTHTVGSPLTERMDLTTEESRKLFGVSTAQQPEVYDEKGKLIAYYQRFHAAMEGLGVCFFSSNWMGPQMPGPGDFVELYNLATGENLSTEDFMATGERIHNLQKLVNMKFANFTRKDDYPQERFFDQSASGAMTGTTLSHTDWSKMLDDYYAQHGWDIRSGQPTPTTLKTLDLSEFNSLC